MFYFPWRTELLFFFLLPSSSRCFPCSPIVIELSSFGRFDAGARAFWYFGCCVLTRVAVPLLFRRSIILIQPSWPPSLHIFKLQRLLCVYPSTHKRQVASSSSSYSPLEKKVPSINYLRLAVRVWWLARRIHARHISQQRTAKALGKTVPNSTILATTYSIDVVLCVWCVFQLRLVVGGVSRSLNWYGQEKRSIPYFCRRRGAAGLRRRRRTDALGNNNAVGAECREQQQRERDHSSSFLFLFYFTAASIVCVCCGGSAAAAALILFLFVYNWRYIRVGSSIDSPSGYYY